MTAAKWFPSMDPRHLGKSAMSVIQPWNLILKGWISRRRTWPRVRVFSGSSILGIYLPLFVFVTPEVSRPPATASYFLFLSFSCYSLELPFHSTRVSRAFTSSLRVRFFASVPPFPQPHPDAESPGGRKKIREDAYFFGFDQTSPRRREYLKPGETSGRACGSPRFSLAPTRNIFASVPSAN